MADYTPTMQRVEDMYSWAVAWNADPDPVARPDLVALAERQRAEFQRALAAHDRRVLAAFTARIDDWDPLTFDGASQALGAVIDAARTGTPASSSSGTPAEECHAGVTVMDGRPVTCGTCGEQIPSTKDPDRG